MNRVYTPQEQMIIDELKSDMPHTCYYCKKKITSKRDLTVDHRTPLSRGGLTVKENLAIACNKCNNEKDDMTEYEYYLYKEKITDNISESEVSKNIKELIRLHNAVLNRIKEVKRERNKIMNQVIYLKEDIIDNNFNASEGYFYAKKWQELLVKEEDIKDIESQYTHLETVLENHKKEINNIMNKITQKIKKACKEKIKKMVKREMVNKEKNNLIQFKKVI